MKPSIAIITRMAFDKPFTENQRERFSEFVNSIRFQSYRHFKVYLLMDSVRNFKGCEENKRTVKEFLKDDELFVIADPERFAFDIEVRVDFDDQVSETFVHDIVQQHDSVPNNIIVSYQPVIIDTTSGDLYHNPLRYNRSNPSMCMALIQKGEKKFGVYDRPHNFMSVETGFNVVVRPEGFYWLQAHGENTLTQLPPIKYRYFENKNK